eukprot:scaffold15838_cov63-Phaeocystis_antarctica.AAC.2
MTSFTASPTVLAPIASGARDTIRGHSSPARRMPSFAEASVPLWSLTRRISLGIALAGSVAAGAVSPRCLLVLCQDDGAKLAEGATQRTRRAETA